MSDLPIKRPDELIRAAHGAAVERHVSSAVEVVLFGSRSMDIARSDSDWDLFVVGGNRDLLRDRLRAFDIVWMPSGRLNDPMWLGSELAGHIANFGAWLVGSGAWRSRVFVSERAVQLKRAAVAHRLRGASSTWDLLSDTYRIAALARIRRDLQRLCRLLAGAPVPPTAWLDEEWRSSRQIGIRDMLAMSRFPKEHVANLLAGASVTPRLLDEYLSKDLKQDVRPVKAASHRKSP